MVHFGNFLTHFLILAMFWLFVRGPNIWPVQRFASYKIWERLRCWWDWMECPSPGFVHNQEFCIMIVKLRKERRKRRLTPETCDCLELIHKEHFTIPELQRIGNWASSSSVSPATRHKTQGRPCIGAGSWGQTLAHGRPMITRFNFWREVYSAQKRVQEPQRKKRGHSSHCVHEMIVRIKDSWVTAIRGLWILYSLQLQPPL